MRSQFSATLLLLAAAMALLAPLHSGQASQQQQPPQPPVAATPPAQGTTPPATPAPAPQTPAPPVQPALRVIVLDPAHGGTDAGARGAANGVLESEIVLVLARAVKEELEHQGLRVLLTRQGNEDPSFDERSALTNGQRGAVFISLHVSSTGPAGTARVYSVEPTGVAAERGGLILWDQAQERSAMSSRRLAELVQVQLAQKFRGSPEVPLVAPVRQLRTVAAPAVAVEFSSVSVPDRKQLEQAAPPLAEAIARGVAAFRPLYESGAR